MIYMLLYLNWNILNLDITFFKRILVFWVQIRSTVRSVDALFQLLSPSGSCGRAFTLTQSRSYFYCLLDFSPLEPRCFCDSIRNVERCIYTWQTSDHKFKKCLVLHTQMHVVTYNLRLVARVPFWPVIGRIWNASMFSE